MNDPSTLHALAVLLSSLVFGLIFAYALTKLLTAAWGYCFERKPAP
jgi:hypothetical protein